MSFTKVTPNLTKMNAFFKKRKSTVYQTLNPIFLISQIGGICTVKKMDNRNGIMISRALVVFHVIVLGTGIMHLILIPYMVIREEIRMPMDIDEWSVKDNGTGITSSQDFITKMANPILVSASAVLLRVFNIVLLYKTLPDILSTIDSVNRLLKVQKNCESRQILYFIGFILLLSWPFQLYSLVTIEKSNGFILMLFFNIYNNFSTVCCEFQFISICWMLKTRFQCINQQLKELNLASNMALIDGELSVLKLCRRADNYSEITKNQFNEKMLTIISTTRKAYKMLYDCCLKLNSLYEYQLLIGLSTCTVNALLNLYFSIFGGFRMSLTQGFHGQPVRDIINDAIWGLYYFVQFVITCIVTDQLTREANSTKLALFDIMNRNLDKFVKQELWIFLTYAMANKIQFSACGFFKINNALITTAIAAGTTYLVILAQFHTSLE